MKSKAYPITVLSAILALFIAGGIVMSRQPSQPNQPHTANLAQSAPASMSPNSPTTGLTAITPHLKLGANGTNGLALSGPDAAYASRATYTAADAVAYTLKYPTPTDKRLSTVTAADITVRFMTDAQAETLLNTQVGLAPTAIVCVVQVSGTFKPTNYGAYVPAGRGPKQFTGYDYQAFDGVTGAILLDAGSKTPYLK